MTQVLLTYPYTVVAIISATLGYLTGRMQRRWNAEPMRVLYGIGSAAGICSYLVWLGWPFKLPLVGGWAVLIYIAAVLLAFFGDDDRRRRFGRPLKKLSEHIKRMVAAIAIPSRPIARPARK